MESYRESGLKVEADLPQLAAPLPGGVDVSAYRVVQELLTNALRYADGPVWLGVESTPDRLRISCANAVRSTRIVRGSGLGLQGMAERVGQLGGTLDRSQSADDRFVVDVEIPLDREPAS